MAAFVDFTPMCGPSALYWIPADDSGDGECDTDLSDRSASPTPLIFHFSPPERPRNPLRYLEHHRFAGCREGPGTGGASDDSSVTATAAAEYGSFRETELFFAPKPFRDRAGRPRRAGGADDEEADGGGGDVEFEVIGVGLQRRSTRRGDGRDEDMNPGDSNAASLGPTTLLDQDHYQTLYRKLRSLLPAADCGGGREDGVGCEGDYEDSLDRDQLAMPPPSAISRARMAVQSAGAVDVHPGDDAAAAPLPSPAAPSSCSCSRPGSEDDVFSPEHGRSIDPTPLSSQAANPMAAAEGEKRDG